MLIDKVGGIGPNYGPRKTEPAVQKETPVRGTDNVFISEEASRAAEVARTARMVQASNDPERAEKLKEVKARLARGEYDNPSEEQLSAVVDSLLINYPENPPRT